MITQKRTYDLISDPNYWSHSYTRRKQIKTTKITINHGDGDTTPLFREKNKLAVTGWLEVTMRTKIIIMI